MDNLEQALTDVPSQPEQRPAIEPTPQPVDAAGNPIPPPPDSGLTPPDPAQAPTETPPATPSPTGETKPPPPATPSLTGETTSPTGETKPPPPREMKVIKEDIAELERAAGRAYFQREYHDFNLHRFMEEYGQLGHEFGQRNEIDAKLGAEIKAKADDKRARKAARRAEALKAGLSATEADLLAEAEVNSQTTPAPTAAEETK